MLGGETEAIRIEEPGVDKAEFIVTTGMRRELHQVRRSHPNGKWSFAALRVDGLLQAIGEQLAGNVDRFVFVSGSDARELAELCDAARDAESDGEFEQHFLEAADPSASVLSCVAGTLRAVAYHDPALGMRLLGVRSGGHRGVHRWGCRARSPTTSDISVRCFGARIRSCLSTRISIRCKDATASSADSSRRLDDDSHRRQSRSTGSATRDPARSDSSP